MDQASLTVNVVRNKAFLDLDLLALCTDEASREDESPLGVESELVQSCVAKQADIADLEREADQRLAFLGSIVHNLNGKLLVCLFGDGYKMRAVVDSKGVAFKVYMVG